MKFRFIIERTRTGYSAYEQKHPIFTTGDTILELQMHALEAANLYLEDEGKRVTRAHLDFEIDFKQFFEFYKVINSKHLAQRIGMNESLLSQYVTGKKKPSKKQVERIIDGLHEIGKELMEINLV
ncbi:MAG: helix-turn-helix transcriptional regulator [Saprospiraceae bacterium]|nr:helix-turn-helix transcriptional regulator [Saprospiraceae bacterium]